MFLDGLDSDSFIGVIAMNGWERCIPRFRVFGELKWIFREVAEWIANAGGFNILNFNENSPANFENDRFQDLDILTTLRIKNDYDHRYVMFGIPGIGTGNGFEATRTNLLRTTGHVDTAAILIYDSY